MAILLTSGPECVKRREPAGRKYDNHALTTFCRIADAGSFTASECRWGPGGSRRRPFLIIMQAKTAAKTVDPTAPQAAGSVGAPGTVDEKQLKELHIKLDLPKKIDKK